MLDIDLSLSPEPTVNTPSPAFRLLEPKGAWAAPIILTVVHSGRYYPPSFLKSSSLSLEHMRQSEDAYIDMLIGAVPNIPVLLFLPARLFIDLNRDEKELDPELFKEALPPGMKGDTSRVAAGLGVLPRLAMGAQDIYAEKLSLEEARQRIESYHRPFHKKLMELVERAQAQFGASIIFDCHSMPSSIRQAVDTDIVLGDCFGQSAAPRLVEFLEEYFSQSGAHVKRNAPYSGGYITQHYGRPEKAHHVVQIEINRKLYMDEQSLRPTAGFASVQSQLQALWPKTIQHWQDLLASP